MANEKRQRQKHARHQKADELLKLERKEVMRQRVLLVVLLGALLGGAILLLTQGDSEPAATAPEVTAPEEQDQAASAEEAEEVVEQIDLFRPPPAGAAITGETPCPEEDGSSQRTTSFTDVPVMCIDPAASYTAVVATDFGDITIALDAAAAPQTVNNFVVLARYGYYEDVPFHRILPGFVIQGGDAVGGQDAANTLGGGNPGYAVVDELPEEGEYEIGSVAMANAGPNTSGSQFFIITGQNGVSLPPLYSLFGKVTAGDDVVEALDAIGTEGAGVPTEVVNITSVTITEE